jgi:hypothetical protein
MSCCTRLLNTSHRLSSSRSADACWSDNFYDDSCWGHVWSALQSVCDRARTQFFDLVDNLDSLYSILMQASRTLAKILAVSVWNHNGWRNGEVKGTVSCVWCWRNGRWTNGPMQSGMKLVVLRATVVLPKSTVVMVGCPSIHGNCHIWLQWYLNTK